MKFERPTMDDLAKYTLFIIEMLGKWGELLIFVLTPGGGACLREAFDAFVFLLSGAMGMFYE